MDMSLVALLCVSLLFASVLYYFSFVKREKDLGGRGKAGIFIIIFVLSPLLLTVLYFQGGSEKRLQEAGFAPHPSFDGSVGLSVGRGKEPTWIFSTNNEKDSILEFYRKKENHAGWSLHAENQGGLVFEKNEHTMHIYINDQTVIFTLVANE